jgi:hypothetical protein
MIIIVREGLPECLARPGCFHLGGLLASGLQLPGCITGSVIFDPASAKALLPALLGGVILSGCFSRRFGLAWPRVLAMAASLPVLLLVSLGWAHFLKNDSCERKPPPLKKSCHCSRNCPVAAGQT